MNKWSFIDNTHQGCLVLWYCSSILKQMLLLNIRPELVRVRNRIPMRKRQSIWCFHHRLLSSVDLNEWMNILALYCMTNIAINNYILLSLHNSKKIYISRLTTTISLARIFSAVQLITCTYHIFSYYSSRTFSRILFVTCRGATFLVWNTFCFYLLQNLRPPTRALFAKF